MAKSTYAHAVDELQKALRPYFKAQGFRVRGRTFNRTTEDQLTQVVNVQMGASDPPGTTYIPGLRENLHGLFTVNLGVYVPEVARLHGSGEAKSWIQDYHCCIRARLGEATGEDTDLWWPARFEQAVVDDVQKRLESGGLAFLDRYATRDKILAEWTHEPDNAGTGSPPRIVMAIILTQRRQTDRARRLLARQAQDNHNPRHPDYVRGLAEELGLGKLDG